MTWHDDVGWVCTVCEGRFLQVIPTIGQLAITTTYGSAYKLHKYMSPNLDQMNPQFNSPKQITQMPAEQNSKAE